MYRTLLAAVVFSVLAAMPLVCRAQGGMPPAIVVTAPARAGEIAPQTRFVGTIYFTDISEVAAEVSGRVETVTFEEGHAVSQGQTLIRIDTSLVKTRLTAQKAEIERVETLLAEAEKDFVRKETLYTSGSIAESEFDTARFSRDALEKQLLSLHAALDELSIELAKATVKAPFDGVILEKLVTKGEWVDPGTVVAAVAKGGEMEAVVDAPQEILPYLVPGVPVDVVAGRLHTTGTIFALIPKGDTATRTFPVKVRIPKLDGLAEGMEAVLHLPSGDPAEAVLVPRDAVIMQRGQNMVYVINGAEATGVPVRVLAYVGDEVAVAGEGLTGESAVGIKGHERIRPGQPVVTPETMQDEGKGAPAESSAEAEAKPAEGSGS